MQLFYDVLHTSSERCQLVDSEQRCQRFVTKENYSECYSAGYVRRNGMRYGKS